MDDLVKLTDGKYTLYVLNEDVAKEFITNNNSYYIIRKEKPKKLTSKDALTFLNELSPSKEWIDLIQKDLETLNILKSGLAYKDENEFVIDISFDKCVQKEIVLLREWLGNDK